MHVLLVSLHYARCLLAGGGSLGIVRCLVGDVQAAFDGGVVSDPSPLREV